jgi:hypothetical protein
VARAELEDVLALIVILGIDQNGTKVLVSVRYGQRAEKGFALRNRFVGLRRASALWLAFAVWLG